MKIIVSQKEKKLEIIFKNGKVVDKFTVDKAENFLVCIDKFLKKHYIKLEDFAKNVSLEFANTGLLTERVIRSIMLGLCFS